MTQPACLYVVPTPIGNLTDITERALNVLANVDWIAAEDTRHSQRLLSHYNIKSRTLSLHDHNEEKRVAMLCERLLHGESVALISDAGTPLISDPGFILVRACREKHIPVIALPGPCAAITALSAAGLPTDRFQFNGFLPVKEQAKEQALRALTAATLTSVYYEAPRRVADTIRQLCSLIPDRQIVLAKELTKTFEHYATGTPADVLEWLNADPAHEKGEFVLIVAGTPKQKDALPEEALSLLKLLTESLPLKKAAAIVAEHYQLKKNALYQAGLDRQAE